MKLQFLNDIKVFIFDVGKTLFDKETQTKCSSKTIAALHLLKNKGYKIGVCTMRTYKHIKNIIDFDFDFYILNNGSYLSCDNEIIIDEPLQIDIHKEDFLTYTPFETYYSNNDAKQKALKNEFIAEKLGKPDKFYNLILFDINIKEICDYKKNYNCYFWNKTKTISLQKHDCSRINAINKLAEHLGVRKDQILYFGDGPNDLEIFKYLPYSIAMGDCFEELLKFSIQKIDTCQNDGIAKFITKYF